MIPVEYNNGAWILGKLARVRLTVVSGRLPRPAAPKAPHPGSVRANPARHKRRTHRGDRTKKMLLPDINSGRPTFDSHVIIRRRKRVVCGPTAVCFSAASPAGFLRLAKPGVFGKYAGPCPTRQNTILLSDARGVCRGTADLENHWRVQQHQSFPGRYAFWLVCPPDEMVIFDKAFAISK